MLFNSVEFLCIFLPITLVAYHAIRRRRPSAAILWLTVASLAFYAYWEPRYLFLLLLSATFNYLTALLLERPMWCDTVRKAMLTIGVICNLGLLVYFKYAAFILTNIGFLFDVPLDVTNIFLPLAISFFTFQQIAYLVDVYREKRAEKSVAQYLLFVSFFPQLIAGPIVHHKEMMPQFASIEKEYDRSLISPALTLIVLGLSKKLLLADTLATLVDPIYGISQNGIQPSLAEAWLAAVGYTLQLYYDFSGYCDIAVGVALLIGIRLPVNFYSPLQADNIIEFWRRWHMTLSRFLRDYLYISLGGNRKGRSRRYINLFLTMLIGGLWHGAGWNFVLWGALHGMYLITNHVWRSFCSKVNLPKIPYCRYTSWCITFLAVVIAFVYFRSSDVASANILLASLLDFDSIGLGLTEAYQSSVKTASTGDVLSIALDSIGSHWTLSIVFITAFFIAIFLPNTLDLIRGKSLGFDVPKLASSHRHRVELVWEPSVLWSIVVALLAWMCMISLTKLSPFLYFQF